MRDTITRTFLKNVCLCAVYADGKIHDESVTIPYGYNSEESAEKYIRKNVQLNGKLASVLSVEKSETLYGMSEADFVSLAKVVDARSKETRDCITKTVVGKIGTLVYMDSERNIKEMPVRVDSKRNLDKQARELAPNGCKGITIENIKDSEALYVMDEATFIANARPMIDHQHYKAE